MKRLMLVFLVILLALQGCNSGSNSQEKKQPIDSKKSSQVYTSSDTSNTSKVESDSNSSDMNPPFSTGQEILLPEFETLFPNRVPVEINPKIEIPSPIESSTETVPTKIGFSADSKKFICCGANPDIDFEACEIIDVETRGQHREMASVDGYQWDENAEKKLQKVLTELNVQDRDMGEWQFPELRFVWNVVDDENGQSVLSIWLEHLPTKMKIKIDSSSVADFTGIKLVGIFLSPNTVYLSMVHRMTKVDDIERFPIRVTTLRPLVAKIYNTVGFHYFQTKNWESAFNSFQKAVCLDKSNFDAAFSAARAAARLSEKDESIRLYLKYALQSGNPSIRKKLEQEKAFDEMRNMNWFKALLME